MNMNKNELEILEKNLERRFSLLIKNTNYKSLYESEMEYLNYLFSEKISGTIIENLIKKSRLNYWQKNIITHGYSDCIVEKLRRKGEFESDIHKLKKIFNKNIPPFYNKYIDSKLHLHKKLIFFFENFDTIMSDSKKYKKDSNKQRGEILKECDKEFTDSMMNEFVQKSLKPTNIINNSDTEINHFSNFHFLLIEEINELKNLKESGLENIKPSNLYFNEKTKQLYNNRGQKSQIIKGSPLVLLKCFLKNKKTLKCKRIDVITKMRGEDQHSGARRQLLSLIRNVADIESIKSKYNKREVEYYQLKGL